MNELKKLNRLNNEMDKNLTKENDLILTDMICYIRASDLSFRNQELIRQDLIEMALSAQERNESFAMVVGENYKEFCDEIIASMPKMILKEKIINYIDTVLLCGSVLLFISTLLSSEAFKIIFGMVKGTHPDFSISYSLATVIIDLIIIVFAIGFVEYICKTSFESTKKSEKEKLVPKKKLITKRFFIYTGSGLLIAIGFLLLVKFASFTVFTANFFVMLILAGCMFLCHKIINVKQ